MCRTCRLLWLNNLVWWLMLLWIRRRLLWLLWLLWLLLWYLNLDLYPWSQWTQFLFWNIHLEIINDPQIVICLLSMCSDIKILFVSIGVIICIEQEMVLVSLRSDCVSCPCYFFNNPIISWFI